MALYIKKAEAGQIFLFDIIIQNPYLHYKIEKMNLRTDCLFIFFEGDRPVGAAVVSLGKNHTAELQCFHIMAEHQEKSADFLEMLFQELYAQKVTDVNVLLIPSESANPTLQKKVFSEGELAEESNICRCSLDEPSIQVWKKVEKLHCEPISRFLKRNGWQSVYFSEADTQLMERLNQESSWFDSRYSLQAVMNDQFGKFLPHMSSMAVFEQQPYAVAMIMLVGKYDLVFQLVSSSSRNPQAGSVMLAVSNAIDSAVLSEYRSITFCYMEKNSEMQQISRRIFEKMSCHKTKQFKYILHLNGR